MFVRMLTCLSLFAGLLATGDAARAQGPQGKKYAVLVGVKEYNHDSLRDLKHTENDVEELGKLLNDGGFDEVILLTSSRGANADASKPTAENIRKQLDRIFKKVTKRDLILVALAGHGLQLRVEDPKTKREKEESFFCPADAKPRDTKDPAELKKTMIPLTELFKELDESGAGVKLMLVDACRNDPKLGRNMDTDSLPRPPRGTAALFSCKGGERAFESDKLGRGHGVFFHFVLEALRGKARNDKGEVLWSRLTEYVTEKVADEVGTLIGGGANQTPQELKNIVGKSPILLGALKINPADLAQWYRKGVDLAQGLNGVSKDEREAAKWFTKAANGDHTEAQFYLGWLYERGKGVAQDHYEAAKWYRKAAEKEHLIAMNNLGWMYEGGRGGLKASGREAERWYRKAADKGYALAMNNLGILYEYGTGVPRDYAEARKWYRKAMDAGHLDATYNLGLLYFNGRGVEKDEKEGVRLYKQAAEKGHSGAMNNIGYAYERGLGVEKDMTEALSWYRKAAEHGSGQAMNNLGILYDNGIGVEKDSAEGAKWFRKGADAGHLGAMDNLGRMYAAGRGVEKSAEEAFKWYKKAADRGHVPAMNNVGLAYDRGNGVVRDMNEAVKWYRKAADGGDDWGTYNMGVCYGDGLGVTKDDEEAVRWYRKAVKMNHSGAMHNLAVHYASGRGVAQDDAEAIRLYKRAADRGYVNSIYNLGWMYENGRGAEKSLTEALRWYRKAAEKGHANAKKAVERLEEQLKF